MAGLTPVPGTNIVVPVGGSPVIVISPNPNGGLIQNPLLAADQGLAQAEPLYVNPVGNASTQGNGTNFVLQPGDTWQVIPGQTTQTSVTAASSGHKFSAIQF